MGVVSILVQPKISSYGPSVQRHRSRPLENQALIVSWPKLSPQAGSFGAHDLSNFNSL